MKLYLELFVSIADKLNVEITSFNMIGNELIEMTIAYKDSDEHIDLETSSKVAEAFAEAIDYDIGLDISSQGAERLISPDKYEEHINDYVFVKFINPKQGLDKVEGELVSVNDDVVNIKYRFKHTHRNIDVERNNIELLRLAVKI